MKKYRIPDGKCVVCNEPLDQSQEIVTCAKCGTAYDLINGKIDNTNTMVGTSSCQHRRVEFISGAHWSGEKWYGDNAVTLCLDCGQFTVVGSENGQHYKVVFVLPTEELAVAAGKYARLLAAERTGKYKLGRGLKP